MSPHDLKPPFRVYIRRGKHRERITRIRGLPRLYFHLISPPFDANAQALANVLNAAYELGRQHGSAPGTEGRPLG